MHSLLPRILFFLLLWLLIVTTPATAQTLKNDYLRYIQQAAEQGVKEHPVVIENWKKNIPHHELWGYDSPGSPVYLADVLGFLYQQTKDRKYAEQARDLLAQYGDLRDFYTSAHKNLRAEYQQGVPAISNFFIMPPYSRAYLRIRESGVLDARTREKIEKELAFSLDYIFHFPEWGAHNRAMLRAESLIYGATALPDHPHARRWRQLAETLASDSLRQWEIEDATGYHAIWLYSLFSYADISGREDALRSPVVRYYLDYFVQLLTPHGNVADFGDAHWNEGNQLRFVPVYEKAATMFREPGYKYFAQELVRRAAERLAATSRIPVENVNFGAGIGAAFTDAHRWADDSLRAEKPTSRSQEVLEDVIGKKVVFRNGWERTSTMMMLNYRDEGDGGWLGREYLRQTLSVEEEKMHHGHADENSIALLMSGGSVLLHDGGYRPDLPSGPFGAWRADYFHNRVIVRKNKRDKKQDVYEFIRNSGAYRQVRTQKVDFLKFQDADASRTRVIDDHLGYQWDRVVTWLKAQDVFIVIDGIRVLKPDYYTFTNLWHTRQILSQESQGGAQSFDTFIDKIGSDPLPNHKALLIHFPENTFGKQIGTFGISRHYQDETAIYQTVSGYYQADSFEYFITVLAPHAQTTEQTVAARKQLQQLRLLATDKPGQVIGLELQQGEPQSYLCVKLDLEMDLTREAIGPRYQYALGRARYGDFETDAAYLFATVNNNEIRYAASTMTKVLYRNQTLMEALPNTFGLQLDGAPARTGYPKWRFWEDTIKIR